jgi:arylsulfatase A-like enzyme
VSIALDRRRFLIRASQALLAAGGASQSLAGCSSGGDPADGPNVLFIMIDDLNDWIGCLGGQAKTPNIDALAARGTLFTRAYTNSPTCGPARASLLTGLRPSTTGIYWNWQRWSDVDCVTLPEAFQRANYQVRGAGKIFHAMQKTLSERIVLKFGADVPYALTGQLLRNLVGPWDDYFLPSSPGTGRPATIPARAPAGLQSNLDWLPLDISEEETPDFRVADWTRRQLSQGFESAFFLGCGFWLPHAPWYLPRKYFDLYDEASVALPEVREFDLDDVPELARSWVQQENHEIISSSGKWKEAVVAYLASISFIDACIGRVMAGLDESPHAEDTIVVLVSDHGLMLGEKRHWGKTVLWEEATRVPMIVAAPGVGQPGARCSQPVSLVDIYPTLVQLCGLPERPELEGSSLVPLLENPSQKWSRPALTTASAGNHSLRSERWRYSRYEDGTEELYDHERDDSEWINLASDPALESVKVELARWLPDS